jgi:hypothetical protein
MGRGAIRKFGAMGGRVWNRLERSWRGWLAVELSENCCITDDGSVRVGVSANIIDFDLNLGP